MITYKIIRNIAYILKTISLFICGCFPFIMTACEDFVEVDPPATSLIKETVFENDVNATAAMLGIYTRMVESSSTIFNAQDNLTILSGLNADEFLNYTNRTNFIEFEENDILDNNSFVLLRWNDLYQFIYSCNSVIEGMQSINNVTDSLALQFEGEAKFVRAWMYFYLLNLYHNVPLVLSTDYETNALLPRLQASQIYDQILLDLQDAQSLLGNEYPSSQRIRPNKAVASALLSRVYLYLEDWENAEAVARNLIDDARYMLEENLDHVFLNTSQEAIWQLQSVNPSIGSYDALRFILTRAPIGRGFSLRPEFVDAFEEDDLRKTSWVGVLNSGEDTFYYPFKFKTRFLGDGESSNEYLTVFRLAEMYLIRAEARARQGNITGALEDLNRLRARAGLQETTATDQSGLLQAIEQERKVELFAELGHRWLDLKRTGRATDVLSPIKPGWQDTDVLWPVPRNEFLNNPNLGEQNAGY